MLTKSDEQIRTTKRLQRRSPNDGDDSESDSDDNEADAHVAKRQSTSIISTGVLYRLLACTSVICLFLLYSGTWHLGGASWRVLDFRPTSSRVEQCRLILTEFSDAQRKLIRLPHEPVAAIDIRTPLTYPLLPPTCQSPPPPPFHLYPWTDRRNLTAAPFSPPPPPSPERFAGIHPAFPPARFLSAVASGYWMANFTYFALNTAPLLYSTHDFSQRSVRAANATSLAHSYSALPARPSECAPLTEDGSSECATMYYYTAEQACWILSHFTVLHIHGDSLARQLWMALLQIITNNFADGHINKWAAVEVDGPRDCQYDAAYSEKPCRRGITMDIALTAATICPALATALLPWDDTFNATTLNETAYRKRQWAYPHLTDPLVLNADEPVIDSLFRAFYSAVNTIDIDGPHPRMNIRGSMIPPALTPAARLDVQTQALLSGFTDKRHEHLHLPLPLSQHVGAVVLTGTGLHDFWSGRWPAALHDYLLNMTRYYVQMNGSVGQIFPLILPIHQMATLHLSKASRRSRYTDTHSIGAAISRFAQSLIDPHRFYQTDDLFFHHYAHHHAHVNRSDVPQPPLPPSYWERLTDDGKQRVVRPYNILDFASLTSQLPLNMTYDGLHYTQRVNVVKAYALLNYLHTLIQQHKLNERHTETVAQSSQ